MKEKKNNKFKNILFKLLKVLYHAVLIFVCVIVGLLLFYIVNSQIHANDENYKPRFSIYTIVSPSMTPVIKVYDVVVNVRVDNPKDIEVSDIITYKSKAPTSQGMTITHRVVQIAQLPDGTYEYMTQGDNNSEPDTLFVKYEDVIGKEIITIPYLGKIQFLIANQKGWLLLLLIPVIIYLIIEIIKLIDLFGLRKRVDKVVGTTEDNIIEKKKVEKRKELERKEKIKEQLKNIETTKDSLIKNELEPIGFLEDYVETVVEVKNNKYQKGKKQKPKILEVEEIEEENAISIPIAPAAINVKEEPKEEPDILELPAIINEEKKINDQYEILDTDELTNKIKEYDKKISQLDKIIKDMERTPEPSKKKEDKALEPETLEFDDFLMGGKIKVIKVEPTKNQKKEVKDTKKVSEKELVKEPPRKKKVEIEISSLLKEEKKPIKEEPKKTQPAEKKKLNLNPNEVKKINRKTKEVPKDPKLKLTTKKEKKEKAKAKKESKKSLIEIKRTKK